MFALGAGVEGQACGILLLRSEEAANEILYIGGSPSHRRQGVATAMIEYLRDAVRVPGQPHPSAAPLWRVTTAHRSTAKKNRASKVKNAGRKYNTAQERTELMNTQGYVPPEKRYATEDDDISLHEEDEEELEQDEQRDKEKGAQRIAELNELREAEKILLQSDPTKYVYKPPELGLAKGASEEMDSHAARNKKYLKLYPKMEYVQWQKELEKQEQLRMKQEEEKATH